MRFLCSSASHQVASNNSTEPTPGGNSTTQPNVPTTMATGTYSSSANGTTPTGAGLSVHPGTSALLLPVTMAASLLLLCYC